MIDVHGFRRDGYTVIPGLVPRAAIEACLEEMRVIFNQLAVRRGIEPAPTTDLRSLLKTLAALFAADMPAYLAAAKLAQHLAPFHRMGMDEDVVAALKALGLQLPTISTRPFMFILADALKVPGGYHATPPHQDFRSIQGSLDGAVVWIPFGPVRPGAYALEVLPGSHRMGLLPTIEDVFGHRIGRDLPDQAFKALAVEAGDAVVFSTLLVHRTGAGSGEALRIAGSFRYNNACEESFVERLYPNPYIYKPDLRPVPDDVASPERVAAVYAPRAAAAE